MSVRLDRLQAELSAHLGPDVTATVRDRDEITLTIPASAWLNVARRLRDTPSLAFTTLIDIVGMDYSKYGNDPWTGPRFAVLYSLLSIEHNVRVRIKVPCPRDDFPIVDSCIGVWPAANWFEREAFDLYGIVFDGHDDLRRILTDYGFMGHPFRKDFPVSGTVEMRYDPEQKRVVYQPVTIEPREIVPRVIREDHYAASGKK